VAVVRDARRPAHVPGDQGGIVENGHRRRDPVLQGEQLGEAHVSRVGVAVEAQGPLGERLGGGEVPDVLRLHGEQVEQPDELLFGGSARGDGPLVVLERDEERRIADGHGLGRQLSGEVRVVAHCGECIGGLPLELVEVAGQAGDEPQTTNVFKLFSLLSGVDASDSLALAKEQERELVENGQRAQIAKYLHGVGDSSNRLVKALGGAFGAGVIARIVRG